MLRIRSWEKWQGEAIYERLRKRKASGRGKPLALSYIAVATQLDDLNGNFRRFSDAVGGGIVARGYLLMVLGYVGRDAATTGVIRCTREQFGAIVLSDCTVLTSRGIGARIYDALIDSGIAEEIPDAPVQEIAPPGSVREASGEEGGEASREGDDPSRARAQRGRNAGTRPGTRSGTPTHAHAHEARDARAASPSPESSREASGEPSGRRGEERRGDSPVAPTGGGGFAASPDASDDPLTAGERAVAAVLVTALEAGKLSTESTEDAAERMRAARFMASPNEEDREKARLRHAELAEAERRRRGEVIAVLRSGGPEARAWIERLAVAEPVRIACLAARNAARGDERDRRRARKAAR